MKPPELLETNRLRLRPPRLADAQSIYDRYAQDDRVTRYLQWRPHRDVSETRAFLQRCRQVWDTGEAFPCVLLGKVDEAVMGMVELRVQGHKAEIGYVLGRQYWGQGYMPEAVRAVVEWALAQPHIYRVWAVCDVENRASARVLEKVGMQREGILRRWTVHPNVSDEPRDCYCYAVVKSTRDHT